MLIFIHAFLVYCGGECTGLLKNNYHFPEAFPIEAKYKYSETIYCSLEKGMLKYYI